NRAIEQSTVSDHLQNDRTRASDFGGLECATQKSEKRRRNFTANRRDDHVPFMDDFPGLPHFQRRQDRDQNEDRQFLHCLESVPTLSKFGIASESKRAKNKSE